MKSVSVVRPVDSPSRIMVAVPTFDWNVNTHLASFLLKLASGGIACQRQWAFEVCFLPETFPVHYARNVIVGAFLASECEALWFLDADIAPNESTAGLLETEGDVVCGRAPIARPGDDGESVVAPAVFASREPDGSFRYAPRCTVPTAIVASGAGCLLIRRHVLADPRLRLDPQYRTVDGEPRSLLDERDAAPAVFRMMFKPNGEVLVGEDIDFVYRAHTLGYRCVYDPRATVGHLKRVDLNAVEAYAAKAARLALEKRDATDRQSEGQEG